MKIKLTKKLPTEEGSYFWVYENEDKNKSSASIVYLSYFDGYDDSESLHVHCFDGDYVAIAELGGYWAKVDQSMFEVVDDES